MWSTDSGGTSGAPCRDGGQRSKGHPRSMDGAEGSQTYQYMHGIDHGRGTQTEVALGQRSGERVCVLRWRDLTTCDVSASPGELICQIRTRKVNRFVDNGPEVRVRCGDGKDKYVLKYNIKVKNSIP